MPFPRLTSRQYKPPLGTGLNFAHSLARGLGGFWLLNEGSGLSIIDASLRNPKGTASSGMAWVSGNKGIALQGGASKEVSIPSWPVLGTGYPSCTACKIYISSLSTCGTFMSIGDVVSGNGGWAIGQGSTTHDDNGAKLIILFNWVLWINIGVPSFTSTGWHTVIVNMFNSSTIHVWIDGTKTVVNPGTTPNGLAGTPNFNLLSNKAARYFPGPMEWAGIWSRALSDDEVRTLTFTPYEFTQAERHYFNLGGTLFTQTLTENQSFSDTLTKLVGRLFTENQLLGDSITKQTSKTYSENVTYSDVLVAIRTFLKILTESFSSTDNLIKNTQKVYTEAQSYTDSLIKSISKTFTENQTITDALVKIKVILKTLTETFSSTDTLIKSVSKTFSETQSYIDSVVKSITKTFTENQTITDTLTRIKVILKTLSESFTATDTLTKSISKVYTETQSFVDSVVKRVSKTFSESTSILDFITTVLNPVITGITNIKNYILKRIFNSNYTIKNSKKENTIKLGK